MKKIALISLICILLPKVAFAYIPDSIERGRTMKIEIPVFENEEIEGSFNGKKIYLYEDEHEPNWDEAITRSEFLKLLFDNQNFSNPSAKTSKDFPDVSDENPFKIYIQKAHALGIIDGYEDGNFGPYDPITRAHIAKILVNTLNPSKLIDAEDFPDVKIDDWHYDYIKHAVQARYFQGYPDGFMQPDRNINFSEAETVLKRALVPQEFKPIENRQYLKGYLGIHRLEDAGLQTLKLDKDYPLEIIHRSYPTNSFYLEPSKNELFASDKIDNTWELINGAKSDPHPEQLWEGEFIIPAEGVLTLGFGDTLYINGAFSGSHFGLDYANVEGTPIYATNNGIVTLAEETMSYGNTVLIDHGHNIFSMYLHNHENTVQKGDRVEKGDQIATMGMTGIATGPHLHFTIFVGDIIVDNYEWYEGKF